MKKSFLCLALILSLSEAIMAADNENQKIPISLDHNRKNPANPRIPVELAPFRFPDIEAFYNESAQTIEVIADENVDAEVTLDWNGETINYSAMMNVTFDLPTPTGIYTYI